jgi:ERCC4-type nuclease
VEKLLSTLGTVDSVKKASLEELSEVVGASRARRIKDFFVSLKAKKEGS